MCWGMWNVWEINVYIVWWYRLKKRDYLRNQCINRQIILILIWKTKVDWVGGEGLSGLDTSGMSGSGSEHQAFSLSLLYTGE